MVCHGRECLRRRRSIADFARLHSRCAVATVFGGQNFVTSKEVGVEIVAPGVGRMTCLECEGDPEGYTAAFGDLRSAVAPNGCVDCKNRGWVYVSV